MSGDDAFRQALGQLASRTLVGDLGEYFAARITGSTWNRRAEGEDTAKTLRSTPVTPRRSIGVMMGNYDLLFAIRLNEEYLPTAAIEVPRAAVEDLYPRGSRVTWSQKLERMARRAITGQELFPDYGWEVRDTNGPAMVGSRLGSGSVRSRT